MTTDDAVTERPPAPSAEVPPTADGRAPHPLVGLVSVTGARRPRNCDRAAHEVVGGVVAGAVVDGSGSTPESARLAADAAPVAARVTARRRSPVHGIATASELCFDPDDPLSGATGAIVAAVSRPGLRWLVGWAGDSTATAVRDDGRAHRVTTPHTYGQKLRARGEQESVARTHDHRLVNDLARVGWYGVSGVEVTKPTPVLVLASDGLKITVEQVAGIAADHPADPGACARALVSAAQAAGSGDDITVLVLHHPDHPGDGSGSERTTEVERDGT
ncbi:hypothetical protein AB0I60_01810 [Actinosynnema sp. NPDC050436]|uniref:PP2C family protein-serine/threonine phosphatase n=1 Tax=Actinosynnema sp. NPDC050436 TaxID=3155659 RepID=UPI0033C5773D